MGNLNPGNGTLGQLTPEQVYGLIVGAGANTDPNGPGSQAIDGTRYSQAELMTAISGAENNYNFSTPGDTTLSAYGSRGGWQIFTGAHSPSEFGLGGGGWTPGLIAKLQDPATNARAAMTVLGPKNNYNAWTTWWSTDGGHTRVAGGHGSVHDHLSEAASAAQSGGAPVNTTSTSGGSGGNVVSKVVGGITGSIGGAVASATGLTGFETWVKQNILRAGYFIGGGLLLLMLIWKLGK